MVGDNIRNATTTVTRKERGGRKFTAVKKVMPRIKLGKIKEKRKEALSEILPPFVPRNYLTHKSLIPRNYVHLM